MTQSKSQLVRVDGEILDRARIQIDGSRISLSAFVSIAIKHFVAELENKEVDMAQSIEKYYLSAARPTGGAKKR